MLQEFSECGGENLLILPTKCSVIMRTLIAHQTPTLIAHQTPTLIAHQTPTLSRK